MTLMSLFSGIGGFELAASRHGITPIAASEIETAPISIPRRHFPDMEHLGDVTKIDAAPVKRGEWMHGTVSRDEAVACSACGANEFITSPFCRECGADMRGEAK